MSRTKLIREWQQHGVLPTLRRATGLGAVVLLLSGCSAAQHVSQGEPAVESSALRAPQPFTRLAPRVYTPEAWPQALMADVYLPDDPSDVRRPAALVVHGGGWRNRTPEDMHGIAEQLAGQGYVAVNIEYRFAPEYRFPSQLHDLQQAMAWIHGNADEWQVDTSRIVGVGFSSGAHLVSLLAVAGAEGPLSEPYGGEQSRLAAVLAGGLPSDLLKFDDGRLVVDFIGGTRAEENEAYRLASPARQITPQAPPFFLFHGKWDQLVPVDHATDFYQALQDNNIESELYLQRWRGHITSFLLRGGAIEAGIAFLNRQVNP
ncbi:alpha/beta hydrolase [Halomonas sp. ISL-60]|uniref:alpha/beta hydrolase n=1 Tax=unclassified Halomonas TaxID=2609666 RepID=UPI0007D93223|nr:MULTISPECIES: alpha/beta hydrolase [unclassified Halomonas]MBT2771803.1 alpha/beta hydrolase [Halomonas sp. ISL-60]MBT2785024.1 alpha/beta hydrolase [Halomonas sp. ISL-106]MBT2796718.1 alpha/beta hydrolase [Halomonas sp. ISL-104]MBT2801587.1 alpha/beta hydrolase [Halomonas sp. ISL-56]OAL59950.1 lipase [Halomonas sp. ALS9]